MGIFGPFRNNLRRDVLSVFPKEKMKELSNSGIALQAQPVKHLGAGDGIGHDVLPADEELGR
jgi:hypothetical protein